MIDITKCIEYINARRGVCIQELQEFIAIPSISTLPEHKDDVRAAAQWCAEALLRIGMENVELMPTPCHPLVYGESLNAPGRPTMLVYGHYDVQPVDPLDEWESDPFAGEIRGDNLYARGASDMKGQFFAHLKAMEAIHEHGGYPLNFKYLLEGEEEMGSPSIEPFLEKHKDLLQCDFVLNCDSGIIAPDTPAIIYALRGLACFEIEIRGARQDLHSGMFGGAVHNPAQVLCDLIAGMHDKDGRVTLPGFYDAVQPLDDDERELIARWKITDEQLKAMTGVKEFWGEKGYTQLERLGARPTLEVNGLVAGYTADGVKTVLPAKALAKISMRLVAGQDPALIEEQLKNYLRQYAPNTITWEVRGLGHGPGALMDRNSKQIQAAAAALETAFGKRPIFRREGGSVPIVGLLQQTLGVDTVMLGFTLPDDNIHGPNEKMHIPTLFKGIETHIRFIDTVSN